MGGHTTFQQLLDKSWGLSAGQVAPVAETSPDPAGIVNQRHPFLLRYKTTNEVDIDGDEGEHYSLAFTPDPFTAYGSRIRVTLVNQGSEAGILEDLEFTGKDWL
jgi:hypothetical protein